MLVALDIPVCRIADILVRRVTKQTRSSEVLSNALRLTPRRLEICDKLAGGPRYVRGKSHSPRLAGSKTFH